jgi:hypothetical protein
MLYSCSDLNLQDKMEKTMYRSETGSIMGQDRRNTSPGVGTNT